MLNAVLILKNKVARKTQIFTLFVFAMTLSSGCALMTNDTVYVMQSTDDLLLLSHMTPSAAEKIQIRSFLTRRSPDTVGGMYSKTYIAYQNGQRELELKYLKEMMEKYPNDPNALHYQSFEGDFDERLALIKHAIELHPTFLNYNFIIKLSDLYTEKEGANFDELFSLLGMYEQKLGEDVYVFDFARGLVDEKVTKDFERANKFFESALQKKGGVENWALWESYFDTKYPQGIKNDNGYDYAYVREVQEAEIKVDASSAPEIVKNILKHKLVKNLLADKANAAGYRGTDDFYRQANHYYFTSEVVDSVRSLLINNKNEDQLLGYLKKAAGKLPGNPDVLGLLAGEYAYLKEYEQADGYYKRAIRNSHNYTDKRHYTLQYRDQVLLPAYRTDEVLERLEAVVECYPSKAPRLYEDFAIANLYLGKYQKAKEYFDQFKANWEGEAEDFPKKRESIINGFVKRELEITGATNEVEDNEAVGLTPVVVATTSVFTEWLAISPDQKYFLGNNGSDSAYTLWDASELTVIDRFENAILSDYYAKYMTAPVYSPDGRYVAYATEFEDDLGSVMLVYDLQKHRFSHQLPMIKKTSGLAWSPDSEEIVIWNYGRLIKYNLEDDEVVQQGEVEGQDGGDRMFWTANGKYLSLLERSSGGSIRVFDAQTLEQLHRLDQVNWPHALGASVDGRYLFSADNRSTLHRWDTEKAFAHQSIHIPVLGRIIAVHPTKPQIIINDWRGRNHLTLIDYEKMEILKTQATGNAELRIAYINNGEKILAANLEDDTYEIYDSESLQLINNYSGESAVVTGGAYANPKKNELVTWDQDGLHVWSVRTGEKLHTWEGDFQSVMSDPDDPYILYGIEEDSASEQSYIGMFDLLDYTDAVVSGSDFVIDKWAINGNTMILSGKPYMPMDEGFVAGAVMVCDLENESCDSMFIDMVTDILKFDHLSDTRFTDLAVSPDKQHIALSTAWIDGWKQAETLSKVTRVFNIETRKLVKTFNHVGGLVFKNNEYLAISDDGIDEKTSVYSIKTGEAVGELGEGHSGSTVGGHTSWPREVDFPDRNLSIEVSKDNRIEFYTAKDKQLVLTIMAKRDDAWIAYLPTGEYSSSEKGADKVYWELDGKKLTVAEAEAKYKREDVIKSKLQTISVQ